MVLRNRPLYSSLNLDNVRRYVERNTHPEGAEEEKKIMVEMLWEHPTANLNSCLIRMLLGSKNHTSAFALTEYGETCLVQTIAHAFDISRFVGVYRFLDLKNHIRAITGTLSFSLSANYRIDKGISLEVGGQEIGDLVYDEYLRLTSRPTARKPDLMYFALIYNSLYRYYRYREIINVNDVTDIVMTHDVYAKFGLVIKAAASLDRNIRIWTTAYTKPISIASNPADKKFIYKVQYYRKEYEALIKKNKTEQEIDQEFQVAFGNRMGARDANQIDVGFVYANNEINTVDQFKESFGTDGKGKIFIMTHAFVDAVRYPLWQNYSDNYVWLRETLIMLAERSKVEEVYVKPHPSEPLYPCGVTVKEVVEEINGSLGAGFIYLEKKVHNSAIFELAKVIITSHGTVGIEAPCLGVKVIAASSCQHEESGTNYQARSVTEYKALLDDIDNLPDLTPEQILSAKIAFLWFNKYVFADTPLLPGLSRYDDVDRAEAYSKINGAFELAEPIENHEIYRAFTEMIDRGHHDLVCL